MAIELLEGAADAELLARVRRNFVRPALEPRLEAFVAPDRNLRIARTGGALSSGGPPSAAPGAAGGVSIGDCILGGTSVVFGFTVAAQTDVVKVSPRINRPFIVNHISWTRLSGTDLGNTFKPKVSLDNDTSGGLNTSGVELTFPSIQDGFRVDQQVQNAFPGFRFDERGLFIKAVVHSGQAAGSFDFLAHFDLLWLA